MGRFRVAIKIPALNEEKSISKIVRSANKYGKTIVVNDGSTDTTANLAKKEGAIVISHKENRGYDAALNSGFKIAAKKNYKYLITLDADNQHDPKIIKKFIKHLDNGALMVLGIRNNKDRLAEKIFSIYSSLLYQVFDPLCGIKAYRREVYNSLGYFDSYKSIGTELALVAASSGVLFKNVRFNINKRSGKSRFGNLLFGNIMILRSLIIWILRPKKNIKIKF
jgi:glycosyltransferase involved in cell wall biosynthesis